MARKRRSRRRGMLSGLGGKVKSLAGTGVQIAGAVVALAPVTRAAVDANNTGGDIGQKLNTFSANVNRNYTQSPEGVTAAVAGVLIILLGSVIKRGRI